jgi:hypothetical protein
MQRTQVFTEQFLSAKKATATLRRSLRFDLNHTPALTLTQRTCFIFMYFFTTWTTSHPHSNCLHFLQIWQKGQNLKFYTEAKKLVE